MKKFKQPLAITGTKEELEALIPSLKELGYNGNDALIKYQLNDCLVTNWSNLNGQLSFLYKEDSINHNRLKVSASNPELVLALAAMTEGEIDYVGEYMMCLKDHNDREFGYCKEGTLRRKNEQDEFSSSNTQRSDFWRKATVEEILNHFKQKDMKKIIGYKAPFDLFNGQIKKGMILNVFSSLSFPHYHVKEISHPILPKEIVETWEPVYEEEKKIIKVKHRDGELEVEIREGKAWGEGVDYDKYQLTQALKEQGHYRHSIIPTHFSIGCKKDISREDIQKVIDAL